MFDKILNVSLLYKDSVFLSILRCEFFKQMHIVKHLQLKVVNNLCKKLPS